MTCTHRPVLHPFLFALFPVLFLYNRNSAEIPFEQVYRPVVIILSVTLAALVLLRLALRDWHQAGLLVTLGLALFFSFGHADGYLSDAIEAARPERNWGLAALWLGLFAAGAWLAIRFGRLEGITRAFNLAGLFLVGWNGLGALGGLAERPALRPVWWDESPAVYHPLVDEIPKPGLVTGKPDIYYIILDGYAQGSVLEDIYDLDNQDFFNFLHESGFTIAEDSHANYPQTILSLTSALNFAYLPDLLSANPNQYSRAPLMPLLGESRLVRFLRGQGYRIVALESGYESTDLRSADIFMPSPLKLSPLENQILSTSAARLAVFELQTGIYRQEIIERFHAAAGLALLEGPKFVFIHLVVPHPPFVFDRQGGLVLPDDLTIADGSHYPRPGAVYAARYREQLLYVNTLAEELLRSILTQSAEPPVILLQADHGPGAYLDWESLENSCLRERLSILNAYHLPAANVNISANITPVNSFRLVLDAYFDTRLGALPDRSFFAIWSRPFNYQDVTDRLDTCAPLEAGGR